MKKYDFIIIGAGISGCSLAYFLSLYSKNILLIDKNSDVAYGASGAAGAFLSPLLGIDNKFKTLVSNALNFSMNFYRNNFPNFLNDCGTVRIPKNITDEEKFQSYIPFMDFEFEKKDDGYFFPIGSTIKPYEICKALTNDIEKVFDYEVKSIKQLKENWQINEDYFASKLFLCTGSNIELIEEDYFDIRAVWGQKIDVLSSSKIDCNYHKECSLSQSIEINGKQKISIGATHNRFTSDMSDTSYNLNLKNINNLVHDEKTIKIINEDIEKLLNKAKDIKKIENVEVVDIKIGARASSIDYFPMVGSLVDSKNSFLKYPHIKNGTHIKNENLEIIPNLYTLNGVGGRGFVLGPYLANLLTNLVVKNEKLPEEIENFRLFSRWAKKLNNKGKN
ncbi:FAD-dependent oxidoreductase [Aliarcobacter cibarius]|uniref:FAD-dependent oxidoreductase n=1 Tax=Aliarcobacter cibarius TaxID=255507 RepID=A0A7L5JPX8_9BACT|nr:FAD-dependent oxidoreductase [Aliarcobacter cibarius]QKJ27257.1 FAD-dependent oxidoreductase, possible FAD-dependent cmnm(5)s(2)U34 oxidoreductase [Aliarcobacter cibarius]TLT01524.1 FAD-dependent oxidoreductase [Aliarcobacter cibarius]TLT02015.1 FAD-dependent oxidoreductase [Aliarcobacter cibarius]TLT04143.1 FAD-dependent oxidoreductase [Aliarcobacter cibarius]